MSNVEHKTVSMDDLRAGVGTELLAEAEVIVAIDADWRKEFLRGKWDWEIAVRTGHEEELKVVRVELESSDELEELGEMIEPTQYDGTDDDGVPDDDE